MHKDFYANNDELKLKLLISRENYLHWFVEYLYGFKIPYYANEWALKSQTVKKKKKLTIKILLPIQQEKNADILRVNPYFSYIC